MPLKQVYSLSLGHDTEFFLWDSQKEKVVPAYKFFPTKEETKSASIYEAVSTNRQLSKIEDRFRVPSLTSGSGQSFRFYRDGLAVEFNSDAVGCRAWIWQDLKAAMAIAHSTALKGLPDHIRFTARPWVPITPQLMRYLPNDCKILGCSPTLDAYSDKRREILVDPCKLYFRTSGAHLHFSFEEEQPPENWRPIIKLADLLIGVPFTYIFGDELEFKRRKLYGQAGEFRFQKYGGEKTGLEYRVLSSRLYNHPAIFSLFSGLWRYAVCDNYHRLWEYWDAALEDDIQEAINVGTPTLFPRLLEVGGKMVKDIGAWCSVKLNRHLSLLDMWAKLRKMNEAGEFPDAGVINKLDFPECHYGWGEYASAWEL